MEYHQFLIGNTSSKGPFFIARLVCRCVRKSHYTPRGKLTAKAPEETLEGVVKDGFPFITFGLLVDSLNFNVFWGECNIWVFPKIMVPPNHPFVHRVFHYKPSILGYPYF